MLLNFLLTLIKKIKEYVIQKYAVNIHVFLSKRNVVNFTLIPLFLRKNK